MIAYTLVIFFIFHFKNSLRRGTQAACLQLAERLFQSFAPLNEKHLLPFSVPFFGNLRSVDLLRSLYEALSELFPIELRIYGGASSYKRIKAVVLDSMSINSLIVFHPQFLNQFIAGGVETTVCYSSSSPVVVG